MRLLLFTPMVRTGTVQWMNIPTNTSKQGKHRQAGITSILYCCRQISGKQDVEWVCVRAKYVQVRRHDNYTKQEGIIGVTTSIHHFLLFTAIFRNNIAYKRKNRFRKYIVSFVTCGRESHSKLLFWIYIENDIGNSIWGSVFVWDIYFSWNDF